jgi:hypothetical protein
MTTPPPSPGDSRAHRTAAWKAALLRELAADPDLTFSEACAAAGVSLPTARTHAREDPEFGRRLAELRRGRRSGGRPPRPWQETSWALPLLDALRADPHASLRDACAVAGVSHAVVYQLRTDQPEFATALDAALGPHRRIRPHSPETMLLRRLREGATLKTAATAAGLAPGTIKGRRRRDPEFDQKVVQAAAAGGRVLRSVQGARCPTNCGTVTGYDYGCRERACTDAKSARVIAGRTGRT